MLHVAVVYNDGLRFFRNQYIFAVQIPMNATRFCLNFHSLEIDSPIQPVT